MIGHIHIKTHIVNDPTSSGHYIISFTVMKMAPGDPTSLVTDLNPNMNEETIARIRAHYGLDQPWHIQYLKWLRNMVMLDFGTSFSPDGRPVIDKILERIPITIFINIVSLLLILSIAIPIGVKSAVNQGSLFDRATTVFVFVGFAMPSFWLALLLMIFSSALNWNGCRFRDQVLELYGTVPGWEIS